MIIDHGNHVFVDKDGDDQGPGMIHKAPKHDRYG